MTAISNARLEEYRQTTFCSSAALNIHSRDAAIRFVNQRHMVFLYPTPGIQLPSLWTAVSGNRPVSPKHDDPGQIIWGWKDELLGDRVWYYAKILRQRSTLLSLEALPYFYALSPNYGDPEIDFLDEYEQGKLPMEAKLVFEALLKEGALDSIALRKAAHLTSAESTPRFNKALEILQHSFKLLPIGIAEAGAWRYAFIYQLTHRHHPDLIEQARPISENDAYRWILLRYMENVGVSTEKEIQRLFGWRPLDVERIVLSLEKAAKLSRQVQIESAPGMHIAIPQLI